MAHHQFPFFCSPRSRSAQQACTPPSSSLLPIFFLSRRGHAGLLPHAWSVCFSKATNVRARHGDVTNVASHAACQPERPRRLMYEPHKLGMATVAPTPLQAYVRVLRFDTKAFPCSFLVVPRTRMQKHSAAYSATASAMLHSSSFPAHVWPCFLLSFSCVTRFQLFTHASAHVRWTSGQDIAVHGQKLSPCLPATHML